MRVCTADERRLIAARRSLLLASLEPCPEAAPSGQRITPAFEAKPDDVYALYLKRSEDDPKSSTRQRRSVPRGTKGRFLPPPTIPMKGVAMSHARSKILDQTP
jgi:hypothetical protein